MLDKVKAVDRLFKGGVITTEGHWLWCGAISENGAGNVRIDKKYYTVHRVSACVFLGLDIDNSRKLVLHKNTCHRRDCFNPDHLYIGTYSQNAMDSVDLGTHGEARKTHCPNGHEYSEENTSVRMSSRNRPARWCKACERERSMRRRKELNEIIRSRYS